MILWTQKISRMTRLVHQGHSSSLSSTPSLPVRRQSLRYHPRQRHLKLIALRMSGTNVKSFLELETTANQRTPQLLGHQALQTGLHILGLYRRLPSHDFRREDIYCIMYTNMSPAGTMWPSILYLALLQGVDFALSMIQETARMRGAQHPDHGVLRATGEFHPDVCQSNLACPCMQSKRRW